MEAIKCRVVHSPHAQGRTRPTRTYHMRHGAGHKQGKRAGHSNIITSYGKWYATISPGFNLHHRNPVAIQ